MIKPMPGASSSLDGIDDKTCYGISVVVSIIGRTLVCAR